MRLARVGVGGVVFVLLGVAPGVSSCAHVQSREQDCRDGLAVRCSDLADYWREAGDAEAEQAALERACQLGDPPACFWRALSLSSGKGGPEDPGRGRALLETQCRGGWLPACQWLEVDKPDEPLACVKRAGEGLEREEIRSVIQAHVLQQRTCFEGSLSDLRSVEGDVTLHWVIGPAGEVARASITRNTFPSTRVAECLREAVLRWRFPCPAGGGEVRVNFPWLFRVGVAEADGGAAPR